MRTTHRNRLSNADHTDRHGYLYGNADHNPIRILDSYRYDPDTVAFTNLHTIYRCTEYHTSHGNHTGYAYNDANAFSDILSTLCDADANPDITGT